jgi:hypothetical protein
MSLWIVDACDILIHISIVLSKLKFEMSENLSKIFSDIKGFPFSKSKIFFSNIEILCELRKIFRFCLFFNAYLSEIGI